MSEIDALLGLYGAVDRAVVAGEADAESLAPLLGAYRDGAATGWYDGQYLPWIAGVKARAVLRELDPRELDLDRLEVPDDVEDDRPPAPPADPDEPGRELPREVEEVRAALTSFPPVAVDGRTAARRLLAVAVAARALPQFFGSDGSERDAARAPLVFRRTDLDPDSGAADELAAELHTRLSEDFTSMDRWADVVDGAISAGLVPVSFRSQTMAPPCTGELILRPGPNGDDPDPVTVLKSEFITDQISFEDAKLFLEPTNWQYPGSFWCRMERVEPALEPNSWLYHETVATSSPPETATWTVSTDLQFWFSHPTAKEARAEYDFGPGLPTALSDIEVDEGSLRIIELPDQRVHVKTTKRVRFAGSFDGAGLAMFMCATGYSTVLEDLVFTVSSAGTANSRPFPVPAPVGGAMPDPQFAKKTTAKKAAAKATASKTTPGGQQSTTPPSGADSLEAIAADTAKFVSTVLTDVTATSTKSLGAIQSGSYKVEDAWSDGISLWANYLNGLGKMFELGTRTAKVIAQNPAAKSPGEY